MTAPLLVWLRQDLRLADNPALFAASQKAPVILIYIFDTSLPSAHQIGAAQKWWLHHSLTSLQQYCKKHKFTLLLRRGDPNQLLPQCLIEAQAQGVYWNRLYDPFHVQRDTQLKAKLKQEGYEVATFNSHLFVEPWTIKPTSSDFFKVFTPFWRACRKDLKVSMPLSIPNVNDEIKIKLSSESLPSWQLLPKLNWANAFSSIWQPGEEGAHQHCEQFFTTHAMHYHIMRDFPGENSTSLLSPHLHFGEISPSQIYARLQQALSFGEMTQGAADKFLAELGWREFSHHLLFHLPTLLTEPFRPEFAKFSWQPNSQYLQAWQQGKTGYPIIDAGMRQLWQLGWMHNRVRMLVASFLTKHLLQDWRQGAAWFWDTLVDADLANNTIGWQWTAGCGPDAAPYFRIFNPIVQGERFDPRGTYVRRFVPELAGLPDAYIHRPWEAPADLLLKHGIRMGQTYPLPLVDHQAARHLALAKYSKITGKSAS